ncbi:Golgi phosphoenolpyruvate transmembrane transporter Pet1 [Schizosaccharomyces osmophilus]|uniref:Golgi phosphoenolpyruvate transmembrane transporter Pet1 n=1 Tax=Schizosaccharomyces osmophilus TaxID=2545709 RepID=A0AAE9WFB2_9SCHI|nr:Golgi phosphoenolpyruvate transmembrane transporter Pet1 [Schizosaccharomyces osmophilus]WBW74619.1 Golgi phosphoenolpyruvate transmembrane transporter Pet1 [Schizosaccharomyces osmophilus]
MSTSPSHKGSYRPLGGQYSEEKNDFSTSTTSLPDSSSTCTIQSSSPKEEFKVIDSESQAPSSPSSNSPSRLKIFFAISSQIFFAILVTILNKQALNVVRAPLFMLSLQMAFTAMMVKSYWRFSSNASQTLDLSSVKQLKKFIFVKILGIVCKTYCLSFVPVSFYQISRGLLLPFTILLSYLLLHQKTHAFPLVGCFFVMLGFVFGVQFEQHVPAIGIVLGIWSSLTTAIESVAVKHYVHEFPTFDLIYIFATYMSGFCFFLSVFSLELYSVVQTVNGAQVAKFSLILLASSCSNFYLNIATFTQIKVTSPVSYMISVATRGVLQTLFAVAFLRETLYMNRIYGVVLILGGTTLYTLAKERERRLANYI